MVFSSIIALSLAMLTSMVSKEDDKLVLWPEYFDKSLTKNKGRRVPIKLAIKNPTVEEIAKAAKRLKLNPKIESGRAYPGRWWRKSGRVLVKTKAHKTKIIRQVAIVIKKYRK
jgi:signal recognition particle subunit SRP19